MLTPKRAKRIRYFSIAVTAYMCAAFIWWTVLLSRSIDAYYDLKKDVVELQLQNEVEKQQEISALDKKLAKRKRMIYGEALFLCVSLSIGFGLVYASYRRALRASKNQTNFLLSITHELKTPIASISLVLETMLKRKLNEEQRERLGNDAMRETKRLNTLVNNLLLSARLDSKYEPYKENLDLCNLCEKIVEEYQYKHPNASFSIYCSKNLPSVYADREGLIAIVHNLLGNAIKYCDKTPEIRIDVSAAENSLEMRVADNGVGIADSEKKKVLKRFYRSDNEATRKAKGTGLGLFIVQRVLKAHKGKIRLEDNDPNGTIFVITLPTG